MKKIIDKYLLNRYDDKESQLYYQAFSLSSILAGVSFLTLVLSLLMGDPTDMIGLLIISATTLALLFVVKAGKLRIASIITVSFLAIACALLILFNKIHSYIDVYQLVFLQAFVLFITLLITTKSLEAIIVMTTGVVAVIINHFFRAIPAQINDVNPDIDDPIIAIFIILFSGLIVISSNRRGRNLLESISSQNARNEKNAENLGRIIGKLQKDFDTGDELLHSSEQMSGAVEEVTEMMITVKREVSSLSESSQSLNETGSHMASVSTDVSRASESQSAIIEETTAAITEMASSIDNIANIAENRKAVVSHLSENAEKAEGVMSQSTEAMENLQQLIQSLGDVNKVISSVAAQTGLLAMNAAIEAAHAGESGKGFAVVADEVRKLSDNASHNAQSISTMLKEIEASIEKAVSINITVTDSFHTIREEIRNVVAGMDEILTGVSELSAGTKEINSGTAQSISSTAELKEGIDSVNEMIQKISSAMEKQQESSLAVLQSVETAQNRIELVDSESRKIKSVGELNVKNLQELGEELKNSGD